MMDNESLYGGDMISGTDPKAVLKHGSWAYFAIMTAWAGELKTRRCLNA